MTRTHARRCAGAVVLALAALACDGGDAVEAGVAHAATPTGMVRCTVKLSGEAPDPPRIAPDKNVEHCGELLFDTALVVREGGVANAVVALASEEAAASGPWTGLPARDIDVRSRGCLMEPRVQTVPTGSRLVLRNGDGITHNPHAWLDDRVTVFNVTLLGDGADAVRTLRTAGVYRIDCDTHSWMRAWVHAFDHPFHAVTDESGRATLERLPAGRRSIVVWHEVLGQRTVEVDVVAGASTDVVIEFEPVDRRPQRLVPPGMQPWIARAQPTSEAR